MSPRVARVLTALSLAVGLAACSGVAGPPAATGAPKLASPEPAASPSSPAAATASPSVPPSTDTGNVADGVTGPELSIELARAGAIRATLVDPAAKAWRIDVAGVGDRAGDRWVLTVETGDVGPAITTVETVNGVPGAPTTQEGLQAGTAKGRICAVSLPVCVESATVVLPADGNGTLAVVLDRTSPSVAMTVAGATAPWSTDPFVLGPWTVTEAFPWTP